MQFCKGAGCVEMAGMSRISKRENYNIIRPLLHLDKQELLVYLKTNDIRYFEDLSNLDEEIKRNSFRHNHTMPLLKEHLAGIKKSFEYIDEDREYLVKELELKSTDTLCYFKSYNKRADIFTIDKHLKSLNYMLSAKEREGLKSKDCMVVGRKFTISFNNGYVFIIPYSTQKILMPKEFKESMRILKVEPKLRGYFFNNPEVFEVVKKLY